MKLTPSWGSKGWIVPLWPSGMAPEWANTAAGRMSLSGVGIGRINEILKEMRKSRVCKVYTLQTDQGLMEYEVNFE